MENNEWILCPICNGKTRIQIRKETELKNFPLFCPKCKKETLIDVKNQRVSIVRKAALC
ncbi:MAG: cysteine-rich KTR domain-containing protein [Lachnospiraceae bacterium]|nr:cysteine-rich KTR domain-containing protein [Lachnospiraceae bacterium]